MEIKKGIEKRCGISLPISGGIANTIKNATTIDSVKNYIEVENQFIGCILKGQWKKYEQKLISKNGINFIDHINVSYLAKDNLIIYLNFYFDISKCL